MRILSLLPAIFIFCNCHAQTVLTGQVTDAASREPLPYVNIGIKKKNTGTVSREDGRFSLTIPDSLLHDTLLFSMVGYEEQVVPINAIRTCTDLTVSLKSKFTDLKPVNVLSGKLVEKKIGITAKQLLFFADGSVNPQDIIEISQLIHLGTTPCKIRNVCLFVNEARKDSGTFRINFYRYDGKLPAERILEKSIIQVKSIPEGWMQFDLSSYSVFLQGDVVVAIEILPAAKKTTPVYYGLKLGGSSRSFIRTSSQGEWSVPPAHYRIYVTAMVEAGSNQKQLEENRESIPSAKLYSVSVQDSFCIFLRLPQRYKPGHPCPVVFLLDANVLFDPVAEEMNEKKNNALLVGIGYRDFPTMDSLRDRDYTFPAGGGDPPFKTTGGAEKFLSFIREELLPWLEKKYSIDTTNMTLAGHSLGGYFTLFALAQSLETGHFVFRHYIAGSPALEYSNYLTARFRELAVKPGERTTLFMTFGDQEDREDGGTGTKGMDRFLELSSILSSKTTSEFRVEKKIYAGYGHMATAIPTFTEGLAIPGN